MRRSLLFPILIMIAVVLSPTLGRVLWERHSVSQDLESAANEYRALGLPLESKDLAHRVVAESKNAAIPLKSLLLAKPSQTDLRNVGESLDQGAPIAASVIASIDPSAKILYQAAERPSLSFPLDWDLGYSLLRPDIPAFISSVRGLCLRAIYRSTKGDFDGANRDLEVAWAVSERYANSETFLDHNAGLSGQRTVMTGYEQVLARVGFNAAQLHREIASMNHLPEPKFDYPAAIMLEMFEVIATYRNADPLRRGRQVTSADVVRTGWPSDLKTKADLTRYLKACTSMWKATHGATVDPSEVDDQLTRLELIAERNLRHVSLAWGNFAGADWGTVQKQTAARGLVTKALAKAMLLRAETGKWPTSSRTRDPLGGGNLKFLVQGDTYRVYSVGPDGIDNGGGDVRDRDLWGRSFDDIAASYPPVPLKLYTMGL